VPMKVRKERNRILRDLAAAKNLAFRESMVGRTLSAVTLHETGTALTGNYLKVELATPREPNLLVDLEIGAVGYGAATVIERVSELTPAHSTLSKCSPFGVSPATTALI